MGTVHTVNADPAVARGAAIYVSHLLAVEVNCHLSLRFGYHALWLEGVAVAGDQIGAINNLDGGPACAEVDVNGSVKIHGGTAGVMLSW